MTNQTRTTDLNGNVHPRMNRLAAEPANAGEPDGSDFLAQPDGIELLEQIRPTLLVFLGGTGQLTAVQLKVILQQRFLDAWRHKIRFLAFDTTDEPFTAQLDGELIHLEAGSEFFNIGNVPVPSIVRNINNLDAIRERLGAAIKNLPAGVMRSGAKQVRSLGLLALLWHYRVVMEELRKAVWHLAGREMAGAVTAAQQQGINVFICGSLVGGTCSGTFLDVAYLIRSLFADLGVQGEFCHITGIGVLPQAFHGITGLNLYPNTGAALKELNHAMVQGGFQATYPDGREVNVPDTPFNLFYVLDGVDEGGHTWSGIHEVTGMAAEGIYLQMASQLGRKGDNAFDNVDEILIGRTDDGDGTFLASFGLGYLEFPAPAVARLCSRWLLHDLISNQWLQPPPAEAANAQAESLLHPAGATQLSPALLRDPHTGGELRLDLRQPGWLQEKRADEVATEAARHVRDFGLARVNEEMLGQIEQNSLAVLHSQAETWRQWVNHNLFAPGQSLYLILDTLQVARTQLSTWAGAPAVGRAG